MLKLGRWKFIPSGIKFDWTAHGPAVFKWYAPVVVKFYRAQVFLPSWGYNIWLYTRWWGTFTALLVRDNREMKYV